MSLNFQRLCEDNRLEIASGQDKHYRDGWINIACPFCTGNPGHHLGYDTELDRFVCWRCGSHKTIDVLEKLLNIPNWEARRMFVQYKGRPVARDRSRLQPKIRRVSKLNLPIDCGSLQQIHIDYLKSRLFDPEALARIWGLMGTGRIGPYKFRIIAPITFEGQLVSYQGRDVTGLSPLRYKACPQNEEVRDHHSCLYGLDQVPRESIVIVEGITDAWRLGPGAVATFGIKYTQEQVRLMKRFKNRYVFFDSADPEAFHQARKLANELSAFQGNVEMLRNDTKDPALMTQEAANRLMLDLGV